MLAFVIDEDRADLARLWSDATDDSFSGAGLADAFGAPHAATTIGVADTRRNATPRALPV